MAANVSLLQIEQSKHMRVSAVTPFPTYPFPSLPTVPLPRYGGGYHFLPPSAWCSTYKPFPRRGTWLTIPTVAFGGAVRPTLFPIHRICLIRSPLYAAIP